MSTTAPASLPIHIIDTVLTFAAKTSSLVLPDSCRPTQANAQNAVQRPASAELVQILHVLPPSLLRSTFCSVICSANEVIHSPAAMDAAGPDLTFEPLVTKTLDSGLLLLFTDMLVPILTRKWRMCTAFVFQLCASGRLDALKRVHADLVRRKQHGSLQLDYLFDALLGAVMGGHVDILAWWHTEAPLEWDLVTPIVCQLVSKYGHAQVLDWCLEADGNFDSHLDPHNIEHCVLIALESECLQVLDWWFKVAEEETITVDVLPVPADAWIRMCKLGNLNALKWLSDHSIEMDQLHFSVHNCIDLASKCGHTDILDWWSTAREDFDYTPGAMDNASANGRLATLEWWKSSGQQLSFTPRGRQCALANQHFDVVRWWDTLPLYVYFSGASTSPPDDMVPLQNVGFFASFGRLDLLQKLEVNIVNWDIGFIFLEACTQGHLHILEAYKDKIQARADDWTIYLLNHIVDTEQFGAMQWCLRNIPSFLTKLDAERREFWNERLVAAAENGSLALLDWIFTYIDKSPVPLNVIAAACANQQLHVLEFLLQRHGLRETMDAWQPEQIDLHPLVESQHLDVVVAWWRRNNLPDPDF